MQINSKKFKSIVQGCPTSIAVVDGDIQTALRIFKKQTKLFGTQAECFDRRYFESKSDSRREQLEIAKYKEFRNAQSQK